MSFRPGANSSRGCALALGLLVLTACGYAPDFMTPAAPPPPAAPPTVAVVDPATALVEARRCGRALAIAARCNYLRDDRDFAVARYAVLQGLESRYGATVPATDLTQSVDLAVLDRLATISGCEVAGNQVATVETGLREVLGSCAAQ